MEAIIEELIDVIAEEIEAFNELLVTLHDKQRAIVEGEIEQLNTTVELETKLANETKSLEALRLNKSQKLAEQLEMDSLNPKLGEIIDQVEKKYAQRLSDQRNLLRTLVGKIQVLNKSNQFLLDYSLEFIEKSMAVLLSGTEPMSIYKKDGKMLKGLKNIVLDQSA